MANNLYTKTYPKKVNRCKFHNCETCATCNFEQCICPKNTCSSDSIQKICIPNLHCDGSSTIPEIEKTNNR